MRRRNRTIERLGKHPLFATCSRRELHLIASKVTERRFVAGDVLIRRGHVAREFIVIVDGSAEVTIDGTVVAHLGPGDFAGEVALLDRRCRTASVTARTDLVALVCTSLEFAELITDAPHMTRKVLAGLAGRLRAADVALAG